MKRLKPFVLFFLIIPIFFAGCNNDEEEPETGNEAINKWMYKEMSFWYFWTHEMQSDPDLRLSPDQFYKSLLSPKDHFSFYSENYQELLNRLKGVSLESGFEYKLYREEEGSTNLIMQISYIKKGSPADLLHLKRGDIIYQINEERLTESNYLTLLAAMNANYSADYRRYNVETETFEEQGRVTIDPVTFAENPVFLDSVYEVGGKRIGYLVYNFFAPGPSSGSNTYDELLQQTFLSFQNQAIDEFILDLRFNNGGSEISARLLSSLIVRNASADDLMFKKQYNAVVEEAILNDDDLGSDFLNIRFSDESENIGQMLSSNKVFVITSGRSASASEVVINSLRPYMEVFIVGETTVGKDAGSVTLYEKDNPHNTWAIQPIVVKLVNKNGEDYPNGFAPDIEQRDNFLILQELGSRDEPLLSLALAAASGGPARVTGVETFGPKPLMHSIDRKAMSNKFLLSE